MTEPTYHFVKGQGWIPESSANIAVDREGLRWKVTQVKVPRHGVVWSAAMEKDKEADIKYFCKTLKDHTIRLWGPWSRTNAVLYPIYYELEPYNQ